MRREEVGSARLVAKPISSEESEVQPEQVPRGADAPGPGPASQRRPDPCQMEPVGLNKKQHQDTGCSETIALLTSQVSIIFSLVSNRERVCVLIRCCMSVHYNLYIVT